MTDRELVAEAARRLDAREPGWAGRIVPERLDMTDCCVLDHVFGRYGWEEYRDSFDTHEGDDSIRFAFSGESLLPYWLQQIADRRRKP